MAKMALVGCVETQKLVSRCSSWTRLCRKYSTKGESENMSLHVPIADKRSG